jgi:hypothetical protein
MEDETMKTLTTNLMLAAAALAIAAGSASAQTMKADIPFSFRVGNTLMSAGSYDVNIDTGARAYFVFRNADTRQIAFVAERSTGDVRKEWKADGAPKLSFDCVGSRCALREAWSGSGALSHQFAAPSLGRDGAARTADIVMTRSRAE